MLMLRVAIRKRATWAGYRNAAYHYDRFELRTAAQYYGKSQ